MRKQSLSHTAAIYARVSSEQQAEAATIASQVAALEERVAQDGLTLEPQMRFLDEGYSGATLIRPALERLRDMAATGAMDRPEKAVFAGTTGAFGATAASVFGLRFA